MIDLLKISVVFLLIVLLLRRKANLGLTMLLGSIALALAFRYPPSDFVRAALASTLEPATLNLVLALSLIAVLENVMRQTGMLQLMVQSLGAVIPDRRIVMALLPAFLGLLPSAGGARFSAPLVEEASGGLGLTAERKSFINYWYRHIWEFAFPLYPALILAAQFMGISLSELIVLLFPFSVVAVLVGAPFAFRGVASRTTSVPSGSSRHHLRGLLWGLSPILVVTLLVVALRVEITLTLAVVIASLQLWHRYTVRQVMATARESFSLSIVGMILAVMLFKEVLMRCGAVDALPSALDSVGVPGIVLVLSLPFLIGVTTGYAQAPVAVGFPLITGLLIGQGPNLGLLSLAFVGGFAGVMLSPAHLCLALTVEHFRANVGQVLRLVVVPEMVLILAASGVVYLIH